MSQPETLAEWALVSVDTDELRVIVGDGNSLVVGSAAQAHLQLPGPALRAEIHREANGRFFLEIRDPETEITINDKLLAAKTTKQPLWSGDEIVFDADKFLFEVRFPRTEQRSSLRIMSAVTAAILGLTLASELFLIGWLPARLSRQEVWGVDVARQKTLALADTLRKRSAPVSEDKPTAAAARQLLSHSLDELAVQLREHGYAMDARQLTACYDVLLQFEKRLNALDDQTLLPEPVELRPAPFLERILSEPAKPDKGDQ